MHLAAIKSTEYMKRGLLLIIYFAIKVSDKSRCEVCVVKFYLWGENKTIN